MSSDSGSSSSNSNPKRRTVVVAAAAMAFVLLALSFSLILWNGSTGNVGGNNSISGILATAGGQEHQQQQQQGAAKKEITLVAQDAEVEIAPGKVVKMWTFNGTAPAPPLRFTEGDNVSIKFVNKTPIPHTIHFHGNHDDANDGVMPQVMPGETYVYNITAAPAGALMYHCHAYPTSLHIRMGMYGALIVDPRDDPLPPAREFLMVMSEYDSKEIMKLEAEYYPINGYADQYIKTPLRAGQDELIRFYVINIGTTIPYQFHLHSATFKAYQSGLLEGNEPVHAQTWAVGPGDAAVIEAKWKYPGTYLFHSHGFLEERGNMGQIVVAEAGSGDAPGQPVKDKSMSMFDWQYGLQKRLQKPEVIEYDDAMLQTMAEAVKAAGAEGGHGAAHADAADNPAGIPTQVEPTANATGTRIENSRQQ